ncbi:MAG: hypothetical protein ONB44_17460 [candidate division KSB1 bacterium]|nr:hypothetical protein [candidate division KSB1 bacterium]MDZ7303916.1 hypothetical protein [candidate division KSB1 bacterium]
MTRWFILVTGALLLFGCAGSRRGAENPELQPWVGTWQGMALQESRNDQPRQWTLVLTLKKGRLLGVMHDDLGEMRQKKLKGLKIVDGELHFTVSYETARGLHMICHHRANLQDDTILSLFEGSEGGRALAGKWEARRVFSVPQAVP